MTTPTIADEYVLIEGDLDEIEKYAFNRMRYSSGHPQPLFQLKQDHTYPDNLCSICGLMGRDTVIYFRGLNHDRLYVRRNINAPIFVDGKEI